MTTKQIWVGLGILILIGLGIWLFQSNGTVAAPPGTNTTATPAAKAVTPSATASNGATTAKPKSYDSGSTYHSLLTQNGSYQCDYVQVTNGGTNTGVVYLNGGKMRAEFRNANSTGNLAVYDGQYLYEWKEGMAHGTRTSLTSLSQLPAAIPKDLTSGAIYGTTYQSVGWNCHSWLTDQKLLTPPSYVTF
jgi:hypothetical protein